MEAQRLAHLATGRAESMFAADAASSERALDEGIRGRRVLIVGGAGSIGGATLRELALFKPAALHVVDTNENELAELVRDLRSSAEPLDVADFKTLPLDFGSPVFHRFLRAQPPYALVLNFAALKHVRSEKDVFSLLQMLDTNVLKQARLLRWLADHDAPIEYFSVSTDKAANPVNAMGASKRLMEHVIFSSAAGDRARRRVRSARFANVAFSNGSLPAGWILRLAKRQPLPCPEETRRFFLSIRESGQLCLLAGVLGEDDRIVVPRLDAARDLRPLLPIAHAFLREHGLQGREYADEGEARRRVEPDLREGCYPILRTPLDTTGEKEFEEFVAAGETALDTRWASLRAIAYRPAIALDLVRFLDALEETIRDPDRPVAKQQWIEAIGRVVPEFAHRETGRLLDDRM